MAGDTASHPGVVSLPATIEQLSFVGSWRWRILPDSVSNAFQDILRAVTDETDLASVNEATAGLIECLQLCGQPSLPDLCVERLLSDDSHPFVVALSRDEYPAPQTRQLFRYDLRRLQLLAQSPWIEWVTKAGVDWLSASVADIERQAPDSNHAPWHPHAARDRLSQSLATADDWGDLVEDLETFWRRFGCGQRQGIVAYRLEEHAGKARLRAIEKFDAFPMDWLQFESSRIGVIEDNTRSLLANDEASNALIWGPRGCGKSTLIRALVGRYWDQGLRAIEIPSASYGQLPALFDLVRHRPESFIAVLDNIALEPQDPAHRTLASLLDGGLEQSPANLVFYATSNYKDLVDRHGERPGGPPAQQADAAVAARLGGATEPTLDAYDPQGLQRLDERRALDDRFALKIFIDLPTQSQYEKILHAYAQRAGLTESSQDLVADFRIWRMRHNHDLVGGRTVRDYVRYRVAERDRDDAVRQEAKGP